MLIGLYTVAEPLPGRADLYFAHASQLGTGRTFLLKTSDANAGTASSEQLFREAALISRLELPYFKLLEAARDVHIPLDYYAALVPGRFKPLSFHACSQRERRRILLDVATAVHDVNRQGVAYRNFAPAAFGRLNDSILLYDFARATAFDAGPARPLSAGLENFDPPEALGGNYDVKKGEAFGIGHLVREAGLTNHLFTALADRLMCVDPYSRPTVEDVIAALRRQAS